MIRKFKREICSFIYETQVEHCTESNNFIGLN